MLTAQAIKDQEFQIKFRGYDAIEVRAYLELLADDYFEVTEQNRVQSEEIESLLEELESLQRDKEALAAEAKESRENAKDIQSEIEEGYQHKDQEIEDLQAKVEVLQEEKITAGEESGKNLQKIAELEDKLADDNGENKEDRAEIEKLRARVEVLDLQNKELKQEGLDFKTTILAAQKFADNLRETSQLEADKLMEDALAEVDKFRMEAEEELSRLPKEIEALNRRKIGVRDELRDILQTYLSGLDVFPEEADLAINDATKELYESIELTDTEDVDQKAV